MTSDVNKFYTKVVELDEIYNFVVYNFFIWTYLIVLKCIKRQLNKHATSSIQNFKMELPHWSKEYEPDSYPKSKPPAPPPLSVISLIISLSLSWPHPRDLDDSDSGGSDFFVNLDDFFCRGLHRFSRRLWFPPDMFPILRDIQSISPATCQQQQIQLDEFVNNMPGTTVSSGVVNFLCWQW